MSTDRSHLVPKHITDVNGKQTTVHVNPNADSGQKNAGKLGGVSPVPKKRAEEQSKFAVSEDLVTEDAPQNADSDFYKTNSYIDTDIEASEKAQSANIADYIVEMDKPNSENIEIFVDLDEAIGYNSLDDEARDRVSEDEYHDLLEDRYCDNNLDFSDVTGVTADRFITPQEGDVVDSDYINERLDKEYARIIDDVSNNRINEAVIEYADERDERERYENVEGRVERFEKEYKRSVAEEVSDTAVDCPTSGKYDNDDFAQALTDHGVWAKYDYMGVSDEQPEMNKSRVWIGMEGSDETIAVDFYKGVNLDPEPSMSSVVDNLFEDDRYITDTAEFEGVVEAQEEYDVERYGGEVDRRERISWKDQSQNAANMDRLESVFGEDFDEIKDSWYENPS